MKSYSDALPHSLADARDEHVEVLLALCGGPPGERRQADAGGPRLDFRGGSLRCRRRYAETDRGNANGRRRGRRGLLAACYPKDRIKAAQLKLARTRCSTSPPRTPRRGATCTPFYHIANLREHRPVRLREYRWCAEWAHVAGHRSGTAPPSAAPLEKLFQHRRGMGLPRGRTLPAQNGPCLTPRLAPKPYATAVSTPPSNSQNPRLQPALQHRVEKEAGRVERNSRGEKVAPHAPRAVRSSFIGTPTGAFFSTGACISCVE